MRFTDEEMDKIVKFGKENCYEDVDSFVEGSQSICTEIYKRVFHEYVYVIFHHKLLITGSSGITDIDISEYIPEGIGLIISGGAEGIDTLAEKYADKHKLPKMIIRPDYKGFGRKAPLVRNRAMVDMCDELIVFWDGKSRRTKQTIDYAEESKKEITVIDIK